MKTAKSLLRSMALLLAMAFLFTLKANAQEDKFPAKFHYQVKTGEQVIGDKVVLTFQLTEIKDQKDYQALNDKLSKQDGIRAVQMSSYDAAAGTATCALTFRHPLQPAYLQKIFAYLGAPGIYFDNDFVETQNIRFYLGSKEKQANPENPGK